MQPDPASPIGTQALRWMIDQRATVARPVEAADQRPLKEDTAVR
jgi:myo-inositol catabolism protein IolC